MQNAQGLQQDFPRDEKQAEKVLPQRTQRFIYLALVLFSAQQTSLFGLYSYLAVSLGISLPQLIGAMALGSFLFLFGQPYWAAKGLRWSRERCIFFAQLGQFLALLPLIFLPLLREQLSLTLVLGGLVVSRIIYGLTASALVPSAQALFAESQSDGTSASLLRLMTTHSLALNVGRLLGPISVLIILPWSPAAVLWLYALLLLAALIAGPKSGRKQTGPKPQLSRAHVWPERAAGRWIFGLALAWASYSALIQSSLAAAIQEFWGKNPEDTARIVALLTIGAAALTVLLQAALRKRTKHGNQGSPQRLLLWGGASLFLSALLLQGAAVPALLWAGILAMAAAIALLVPSTIAAMNLYYGSLKSGQAHNTSQSSQAAANLGVAQTLGFALGGALSALGLSFRVEAPFFIALAVAALVMGCVICIKRQSWPQKGIS